MRTLLDRFSYAFDADLRAKWTKPHRAAARSTSYPGSGSLPVVLHTNDDVLGDADKSSDVDYDLLFAELFGVMPWLQT